MDELFPEEK